MEEKNKIEKREEKIKEIIKKYKIDIEKLKLEQIKLSKELEIKDKIDFSLADKFGAIDNVIIKNKIISCAIVCDKNFDILDKAYVVSKLRFPYIPGFRNYREIEAMRLVFDRINERPDLFFIPAPGIIHQRLGLASHFGLVTGIPTIGISDVILGCEIKGDDIFRGNKKVGKVLLSKIGSKPIFISPGNYISLETAFELTKKLIKPPHKNPEPIHLASKYAKHVLREIKDSLI